MQKNAPPLPAPQLGEPYLLTPGPLTTSYSVKEAMLKDWGSWDSDFQNMTAEMCDGLVSMAGEAERPLTCIPVQGSGSFVVEAMLGTFIPPKGKVLVLCNGAYGKRSVETLKYMGIAHTVIDKGDFLPPRGVEVAQALAQDPDITHVLVVHCETSSGILNPVQEISDATYQAGRRLLIDSMSAFGAIILPKSLRYEAVVSSANKCIEGVPGFGFVICAVEVISACQGNSPSLCLDLYAQWSHMQKTGQWRFTPPTHVVAAFLQALKEHRAEGGVVARGARYTHNKNIIVQGMRDLGFETLLSDAWLSPIIVTFFCPAHEKFHFLGFYDRLKSKGFIVYPGKLTAVGSFRIGCIGQMDHHVMNQVLEAVKSALLEMNVDDASPPKDALAERALLAEYS